MNTDVHANMRRIADERLAGSVPLEQKHEQSLQQHVLECAACREYLDAGQRVVAGLGGYSFAVDADLQARVLWSLQMRARQLEATQLNGRRLVLGWGAALVLLVAGSWLAWHFGSVATAWLHLQPSLVQRGIVLLWVLPSLCFFLLFPMLPLLSNRSERAL